MGISLGLVGLGAFGSIFAKLFKAHPVVDRVALCDAEPEKMRRFSEDPFMADKLGAGDCYPSLDGIRRADLDALVIMTQPWLHAPQCIQALEAGKHVYSAVPAISLPDGAEILDWCAKLKRATEKSGKQYMLGETTIFRPQAMFCRRKALAGAFGDFVYAEGEYAHDVDNHSNLRDVRAHRTAGAIGGQYNALMEPYRRRGVKGGPMFYPTHSVSGPIHVMDTRALKVAAFGYRNRTGDAYFAEDAFSNIVALYELANGASLRVGEFREIGAGSLDRIESETFRVFGNKGGFSANTWQVLDRHAPRHSPGIFTTQKLEDKEMRDDLPAEVEAAFKAVCQPDAKPGDDFTPAGHGGSHPYLVHEFCMAVAENRKPVVDIDAACHYMAMGVAAHQSALRDGECLEVPVID